MGKKLRKSTESAGRKVRGTGRGKVEEASGGKVGEIKVGY